MMKLKQSLKIYLSLLPLVYFIPPLLEKLLNLNGFVGLAVSTAVIVSLMVFFILPGIDKVIENISTKDHS